METISGIMVIIDLITKERMISVIVWDFGDELFTFSDIAETGHE